MKMISVYKDDIHWKQFRINDINHCKYSNNVRKKNLPINMMTVLKNCIQVIQFQKSYIDHCGY